MSKRSEKSPGKRVTKSRPTTKAIAKTAATSDTSLLINERIRSIAGWRGETLAHVRSLILAADPDMTEEVKWRKPSNSMLGVPVWSHAGIVCTGETYKNYVKLTFAKGASLADPARLFNSSLEGNTRRAIDIHEGEQINARAFQTLIRAAVALNSPLSGKKPSAKVKPTAQKAMSGKLPKNEQGVVLLSGGNPQIAKADGNAPVQAYIAAMPGWKSPLGKRLDQIIERTVPQVQKAVRWNSPFYGVAGQGWFATFHVLTRYVKVTFFSGAALRPLPPGVGKDKNARWLDIYEHDALDESQFTEWIKQAAAIPGWKP